LNEVSLTHVNGHAIILFSYSKSLNVCEHFNNWTFYSSIVWHDIALIHVFWFNSSVFIIPLTNINAAFPFITVNVFLIILLNIVINGFNNVNPSND